MNQKNILLMIMLCLIFGLHAASGFAGDEKSDKLIQNIKNKYDKLKTFKADFVQIAYWKLADNYHEQSGSIWLKGKDKFKIETKDQSIIANGTTIWTFSAFNNQVIIEKMTKSGDIKLPGDIFLTYSEQYESKYTGEEVIDNDNCHVIDLTGKTDDLFIKTIKIWISMKSGMPVKIEQLDLNGNKNTFILTNMVLDDPVPDDFFDFKPPESAEVIDMR